MKLLKGNILAKPYYLQHFENNVLVIGKKKLSDRISEVMTGIKAKSVMHKQFAYKDFEDGGKTYRVLKRKDVLMYGDLEFNEKDIYAKSHEAYTVMDDFIAVEPIGMKKKVHTVQGANPTPYQSSRVIAVKDNEGAGIKAGDELIVRPVALVVNLNIVGNGTPTWYYVGRKIHVVLSVNDVVAKVVDGNLVPLKDYLLVKLNYEMTEEYQAMRKIGLEIPENNSVKTKYADVIAGGSKIDVKDGAKIIFEKNLVVKIDSDLINSADKEQVIYRVDKRNILAEVNL